MDISEILKPFGHFNDHELLLFSKQASIRKVVKKEVILKQGNINSSAFYLIRGAAYHFVLDNENEEKILDLHIAGDWFLNHESFVKQKPSDSSIVAYCDGEILELNINAIHYLIERSPSFFKLGAILHRVNERLQFFDNNMNPMEKYKYILVEKPELLQNFPLKIIASYLKIKPETLSRVRETVAKDGIS